MFALLKDGIPVAYHKSRILITEYKDRYYDSTGTDLMLVHMKKKVAKKRKDFDDLYLIPCDKTLIQRKYSYVRELDVDPLLSDLKTSKDVLLRLIECMDSESDIKKISKVLDIIDREMSTLKESVLSLEELKSREDFYEEWKIISKGGDYSGEY